MGRRNEDGQASSEGARRLGQGEMLMEYFLGKKICIDTTGQKTKLVLDAGECRMKQGREKVSEIQSFKH